jgi:hypothetical protein
VDKNTFNCSFYHEIINGTTILFVISNFVILRVDYIFNTLAAGVKHIIIVLIWNQQLSNFKNPFKLNFNSPNILQNVRKTCKFDVYHLFVVNFVIVIIFLKKLKIKK